MRDPPLGENFRSRRSAPTSRDKERSRKDPSFSGNTSSRPDGGWRLTPIEIGVLLVSVGALVWALVKRLPWPLSCR
jgi:hypothetical protein